MRVMWRGAVILVPGASHLPPELAPAWRWASHQLPKVVPGSIPQFFPFNPSAGTFRCPAKSRASSPLACNGRRINYHWAVATFQGNIIQSNFSGFPGLLPDGSCGDSVLWTEPTSAGRVWEQVLLEELPQGLNPSRRPPDSSCQCGGFSSRGSLFSGAPFHTWSEKWDTGVEFYYWILSNSC